MTSVAPDLDRRLRFAGTSARRRVAGDVALWAVRRAAVDDEVVRRALRASDGAERAAAYAEVVALVETLDAAAWRLRDEADRDAYVAAFARARAVDAVAVALERDDGTAASEVVYEAWIAVDDPAALRAVVVGALRRRAQARGGRP